MESNKPLLLNKDAMTRVKMVIDCSTNSITMDKDHEKVETFGSSVGHLCILLQLEGDVCEVYSMEEKCQKAVDEMTRLNVLNNIHHKLCHPC